MIPGCVKEFNRLLLEKTIHNKPITTSLSIRKDFPLKRKLQ